MQYKFKILKKAILGFRTYEILLQIFEAFCWNVLLSTNSDIWLL